MGPTRIHNQLNSAVAKLNGNIEFFDDPAIIKKNLEAGCPSEFVEAVIYFGGSATILKVLLPPLKDAMITWLQLQADREIELHANGHQVRIKGRNDVDEAIEILEKISTEGTIADNNNSTDTDQ